MKLKILKKYSDGTTKVDEIEIDGFQWTNNHKFEYTPIWNGHSISRYIALEDNEDILELKI